MLKPMKNSNVLTCFASQSESSPEWSVCLLKFAFESVVRMLNVFQEIKLSPLKNKLVHVAVN